MNNLFSNGFLSIHSDDRPDKNKSSNRIRFENLNLIYSNVSAIGLSSYTLFNSTTNINDNNNTLGVSDGVTSYPVTLANKNYDLTTFIADLETELNAQAFAGFSVVLDPDNNSINISNAVAFQFFRIENLGRDLAGVAGMPYEILSNSHIGVPDLTYSKYIDVVSYDLNRDNTQQDKGNSGFNAATMGRIYIKEHTEPSNICYEYKNIKWCRLRRGVDIGSVEISLIDEYGKPYNDDLNSLKYSLLFMTI